MQPNVFDVIIIGAGVSGIGMACTLKTRCNGADTTTTSKPFASTARFAR